MNTTCAFHHEYAHMRSGNDINAYYAAGIIHAGTRYIDQCKTLKRKTLGRAEVQFRLKCIRSHTHTHAYDAESQGRSPLSEHTPLIGSRRNSRRDAYFDVYMHHHDHSHSGGHCSDEERKDQLIQLLSVLVRTYQAISRGKSTR